MVRTRSQLKNLSREELIEELITVKDITSNEVVQLERNAVTNAQYHRRELVEVNPVPPSINDEKLELNIWKALSLTGHEVKQDDLLFIYLFGNIYPGAL